MIALLLALCMSFVESHDNNIEVKVAEVKPHYQCVENEGQDKVRSYITELMKQEFGIISVLQTEFAFETIGSYHWMAASCTNFEYSDVGVVLFDSARFEVLKRFGVTTLPRKTSTVDTEFLKRKNDSCVGENITAEGLRVFAAALMREKRTNIEFCFITATLPHPEGDHVWTAEFNRTVNLCRHRFIFIGDTNIGTAVGNEMRAVKLFPAFDGLHCSDPGAESNNTCCLDTDSYDPRYRSDRIIACRHETEYQHDVVEHFQVEPHYYCNSGEEHRFITANVNFASSPTHFVQQSMLD